MRANRAKHKGLGWLSDWIFSKEEKDVLFDYDYQAFYFKASVQLTICSKAK